MPTDFSKYSDDQLKQIASSMGGQAPVQTSQNPSITSVQPAQGDVVFSGASGIENLPGRMAVGNVDTQLAVDKQRALIPLEIEADIAKKKADLQQTRDSLQKGLKTFLMYDQMIPRGEGFIGRHLEGLDSFFQGLGQSGERGVAVKMHNDMIEGLKTPMAKVLGNMGNLAVPEQNAARQLFTRLSDSQEVTEGKRAFLIQIATGIENNDPTMVKDVIKNFMGSAYYDPEKDKDNNDIDLDELLPPVDLEQFKL